MFNLKLYFPWHKHHLDTILPLYNLIKLTRCLTELNGRTDDWMHDQLWNSDTGRWDCTNTDAQWECQCPCDTHHQRGRQAVLAADHNQDEPFWADSYSTRETTRYFIHGSIQTVCKLNLFKPVTVRKFV